MPISERFKAIGAGNGFTTCNMPEFDCTIGNQFKNLDPNHPHSYTTQPIVQDYITLGGYKGSDGGGPSDHQLELSLKNAMKIFWNWHGVDVNVGGSVETSSSITSVKTFQYVMNRGSQDPLNPEQPPVDYTLTTNTSSTAEVSNGAIISSSNLIHTSNKPKERLTSYPNILSKIPFIEQLYESNSKSDTATDSFSGNVYVYDNDGNVVGIPFTENFSHGQLNKRTQAGIGGLGTTFETEDGGIVQSPFAFGGGANFGNANIIKLFDNGNFVGYGVRSFFTFAAFEIGGRADGNSSALLPSRVGVDCVFDLSSIFLEDETMDGSFHCPTMDKRETLISGIPTFLIVGQLASSISDQTLVLEFPASNKVKFTSTGITRTAEQEITNLSDDDNIINLAITDTVSNSSSLTFTFEVANLHFYTYLG